MNNIFDIARAKDYAVYTIRSGAKKYAIAVGAGIVCALIYLLFIAGVGDSIDWMYTHYAPDTDPLWNNLEQAFWVGLVVVLSLPASLTYSCLASKEGRISELMLPASHLEKYAVRWLIFILLSLVVYVIGFEIVDYIRILIVSIKVPDSQCIMPLYKYPYGPLPFAFLKEPGFAVTVALQSLFMLGSAIWPKLSALKTLLALAIIATIVSLWSVWLANALLPYDMVYDGPFEADGKTVIKVLSYSLALVCYVITYFRIKEIEIIQRW